MAETYDFGSERVIVLNKAKDHAGVYHNEMHGNYGTAMIFDGNRSDCLAWVKLWHQWPRDEAEEQRFKELSKTSDACPVYHHHHDDEDWSDEDEGLYSALIF